MSCRGALGEYKCKDCFSGSLLLCRDCMIEGHGDFPLHCVEVSLILYHGLILYLNSGVAVEWSLFHFCFSSKYRTLHSTRHGGAPCPNLSSGPPNFCMFNISGVHHLSIDFCDCRTNGIVHNHTQLLCARWFPSTFNRPQTVFTFDCLDTFHELTLQGKTTLYNFYYLVLHKTDNLELQKPVVSLSYHCRATVKLI
jgi:hypothetical protein